MHSREHPVWLYHRLVWQLHRPQPQGSPEGSAVCTMHHWGQTTCPPWHLQHPMSQEGQKDHQGHQPSEPLPVHPAIIQKARSVQVHQSWDRETEKQLLSQGHHTVKQPLLLTYRLEIIGHFNKWITRHVYISCITHLICIYCVLYHLLHLLYNLLHAAQSSRIHIFICIYSYSIPLLRCVCIR